MLNIINLKFLNYGIYNAYLVIIFKTNTQTVLVYLLIITKAQINLERLREY